MIVLRFNASLLPPRHEGEVLRLACGTGVLGPHTIDGPTVFLDGASHSFGPRSLRLAPGTTADLIAGGGIWRVARVTRPGDRE